MRSAQNPTYKTQGEAQGEPQGEAQGESQGGEGGEDVFDGIPEILVSSLKYFKGLKDVLEVIYF